MKKHKKKLISFKELKALCKYQLPKNKCARFQQCVQHNCGIFLELPVQSLYTMETETGTYTHKWDQYITKKLKEQRQKGKAFLTDADLEELFSEYT